MTQPVEGRRPQEPVRKRIPPFTEVEIARDDGGGPFVAFADEVMQILVLGRAQGLQAKIIDDEKRYASNGLEAPLEGVGGAGGMKAAEQLALGSKEHLVSLAYRTVAQGLGEMALAGAAGPGDEDGGLLGDEPSGGELLDRKRFINPTLPAMISAL